MSARSLLNVAYFFVSGGYENFDAFDKELLAGDPNERVISSELLMSMGGEVG